MQVSVPILAYGPLLLMGMGYPFSERTFDDSERKEKNVAKGVKVLKIKLRQWKEGRCY